MVIAEGFGEIMVEGLDEIVVEGLGAITVEGLDEITVGGFGAGPTAEDAASSAAAQLQKVKDAADKAKAGPIGWVRTHKLASGLIAVGVAALGYYAVKRLRKKTRRARRRSRR